ncbi:MAG: TRAP transporter permease [Peptococcales bacterium]|jgi:TRAP transporter 4TM/12TM fusion protein
MKRSNNAKYFKSASIIFIIAVAMSLFHIYTGVFGVLLFIKHRAIHIAFALVLCFLSISAFGKFGEDGRKVPFYDWILALLAVIVFGYFVVNGDLIARRYAYVTPLSTIQLTMGILAIILLIEGVRRSIGTIFVVIIGCALAYAALGPYLPFAISHKGFTLMWTIDHLAFTDSGIFGRSAGVSATYIFIFILFGAFLEKTGAGDKFIKLAFSLVGKQRGGPAKAAVIASGLFGMISGTAVGNVVTTGTFTIPMMKKLGYQPEFAGGVEACASSGGQIMPPLMGATAFLIAEFTGIPYIDLAKAAAIPAIMYFFAIFVQVHLRALVLDIKGMPREELPPKHRSLTEAAPYMLSIIAIVVCLLVGFTPLRSGLLAIIFVVVVNIIMSFVTHIPAITIKQVFQALEGGAKSAIPVALVCSASGIVSGIVVMSGIGLRVSSVVLDISGGNLFFTLLIVMVTSIILGMGLPTVAAYIIQVSLTIPALLELGVPPLASHMFIFYFGALSAITPPIALAAYAAAGIADSPLMKTGFVAFRLALSGFIIPFMFVYSASIILIGSPIETIITTITLILGIIALSFGVEGWIVSKANILERLLCITGAILLILPGVFTDLTGFAIIGSVIGYQFFRNRNVKTMNEAV